jgi:hypothetical protein
MLFDRHETISLSFVLQRRYPSAACFKYLLESGRRVEGPLNKKAGTSSNDGVCVSSNFIITSQHHILLHSYHCPTHRSGCVVTLKINVAFGDDESYIPYKRRLRFPEAPFAQSGRSPGPTMAPLRSPDTLYTPLEPVHSGQSTVPMTVQVSLGAATPTGQAKRTRTVRNTEEVQESPSALAQH